VASLPFPHPPLRDGAIVLREWSAGDVPAIVAAGRDPDLARYTPLAGDGSGSSVSLHLAHQSLLRESGTGIGLAISPRAGENDGKRGPAGPPSLLGSVSLRLGEHARAEIGYWLVPAARGQGTATRAVVLLSRWAFSALRVVRIELLCQPANAASMRVAERAGYTREGLLRSYRAWGEGRRDFVMFSLLPDDRPGAPFLTEKG
jgi:RimJ/RimL family protein N-acetyltransferase